MPDSKITALTSISTSTDPANDPLVIVDLSDTSMAASGTTKKVTLNQLLGASGTATLASATITGDLTVDTSTLKVDSANNRVGIRTASPAEPLTVDNSSGVTTGAIRIYATDQSHSRLSIQNGNGQAYHLVAGNPGASNAGFALYDNTGAATRWYVDNTGVHTWSNVGGVAGTAMTLNSTGLGVGGSPTSKLSVFAGADGDVGFFRGGSTRQLQIGTSATAGYLNADNGSAGFELRVNGTARAYFDTSGNVGIGVTPSAWATSGGYRALQIGGVGIYGRNTASNELVLSSNAYFDTTDSRWEYITTAAATRYDQQYGAHQWFTAASGTLNTAITFTQSMTLDASGRLILLASTTTPATLATNGELTFTATSNTNLRFSYRGSDGVTRTADLTLA